MRCARIKTGLLVAAISASSAHAAAVTNWTIATGGGTAASSAGNFSLTNATGGTAVNGSFGDYASLNSVGDSITLSATLTQTVSQGNVQFRFGLFDSNSQASTGNWLGYYVGNSVNNSQAVAFRRSGSNGTGYWSGTNGGAYFPNTNTLATPTVMPAGTYALSLNITKVNDTSVKLDYSLAQTGVANGYSMVGSSTDKVPQQLAPFRFNQAGFLVAGAANTGNVSLSNVDVVASNPVVQAPQTTAQLKVMTFNVQHNGGGGLGDALSTRGWNSTVATPRRGAAVAAIQTAAPDIFGVQEAYFEQMENLKTDLGSYSYTGVGRNNGTTGGEYAGVFFKTSRFTQSDSGNFWLSNTPNTPGTTFSNMSGATPRIASWVKLYDKETGKTYFVLDTHLDNQDAAARNLSADLIRSQIKTLAPGLPVLVLGDFNTLYTDTPATTIRGDADANGPFLLDSYNRTNVTLTTGTYNPNLNGSTTQGGRIDYVLGTPDFQTVNSTVYTGTYNGIYPSDHYPVMSTFNVAVAPEPGTLAAIAIAGLTLLRRTRQ